ncbi:MAG: hypothetical protein AB2556_24485, partial [Candidatus Thiodiazotropha sp.]
MAVWLLGGQCGQQRQLSVDQFEFQDGRSYRTQEKLQAICAKLGNSELADRAFGENHVASTMAKEKNGWRPIKLPQELTESEPKAYPKHQRERWTNTSSQT